MLFILIGIFGSDNRVKASFYLFLYTLLGSLFLLLSILAMSSIMSTTDFDTLFKGNFLYLTQLFLFYGIFIAFAVKTPTIFLNTWLLKAHVESPLGGSIILAAIVLKLSLYGILRLILPVLPKAYMEYTYIIFLIGVITIVYASLSTLRTIDIKELIAYSSVSHAAVYLLGVFSNSIQGIEGAINLGLAHGLVSPGLFICAGGVLYDRSSTRVISFYRGVTQVMPLFAILFFILCLANCGAPLSLNFIGEFLSLYGVFERSSLFGVFASSSIIFSAAYTIYMYQRIAFGGSYSRMFTFSIPDLTKREFTILLILVIPTVLFGIYPAPILDAIHYSVSTLIYLFDSNVVSCDSSSAWESYFKHNSYYYYHGCFALSVLILLTAITIKFISYNKEKLISLGKTILWTILATISFLGIFLTLYIINSLYCLYWVIDHIINNELGYNCSQELSLLTDATVMNADLTPMKYSVFLSSGGDNPNISAGGDNPNISAGQVPGPSAGQVSGPSAGQVPGPSAGQVPGPSAGQVPGPSAGTVSVQSHLPGAVPLKNSSGEIQPGLFTNPQPWEHFKSNCYNTYNINDGQVDHCEYLGKNHGWNPRNVWNHDKGCEPCYNCKKLIDFKYYKCDACCRAICGGCDTMFNRHAAYTFTDSLTGNTTFPRRR